jgi:hypothetical protein
VGRVLSATLATAVGQATRVPTVALTIEDHIQHFATYQSPGNADAYHDASLAADGSIVRVQVTRGSNALQQSLRWQRVTDPTQASQWQSWTTFGGGSTNCFQDGLCAVSQNPGGTLRAFVLSGSGSNLWSWSSSNNGASWSSSPTTVLTIPSSGLVKGIASAGNNDVFFLYDVTGGEAIGCSFFSGSSWSTLRTWTLATLSGASGLDVYWTGSVYSIVYSDGYSLKQCTFNPGTLVWTALPDIAPVTTTAIARINPRLTYDASTSLYNLACIEADSGLLTGSTYSYPRIRQSADLQHWSNGFVAHDISATYGAVLLQRSNDASYLISMPTIQRSPNYSTANTAQYLDSSAALLSYTRKEQADRPARIELELDNTHGALSNKVGSASSYQPINLNASLVLSEGYKTGATHSTIERVKTGTYRINQIVFLRSPQQNRLKLIGYDLSRNLDLLNRYQVTYSGQTVAWMVTEITARAGLFHPFVPTTSATAQTIASFVLQAGQPYRRALDDLCATYHLMYFLDESEVLQFRELSASDAASWSYQPEVELVSFGSDDERSNHIVVTGKPPTGGQVGAITSAEVHDDANQHQVGLERLLHHVDPKLSSSSQCLLKAQFLLAQQQRTQVQHSVTVPLNPALQPLDVVSLSDTPAGGTGQSGNARIMQTSATYEPQRAIYHHELYLEGV